jgi:hypothetical protein
LYYYIAATLYQLAALRNAAGDGDGAAAAYERAFAILDLQEYEVGIQLYKLTLSFESAEFSCDP